MKKFIAYLSILLSIVLGVVAFAKPSMQGINGGYDYQSSKEYLYQIVNEDETLDDYTDIEDKNAVENIAKEFETRLLSYGVSSYDIEIQGNDKIKVTFSAQNDTIYQHISSYLAFDGNLSLVTYDGEVVYNNFSSADDSTIMFGKEDAYLEYKNDIYPGVIIPLTDAATFNERAVAHAEEINNPGEDEDLSDEGYIYLWTRYNANTDTLENANKNENIKSKLLLAFPYNSIFYEENEDDYSSIAYYFSVDGIDQDSTISDIDWSKVSEVTENAKYYMHLINASHLDYRVYTVYSNNVTPNIETLVNYGLSITPAMSKTLLATLICYAIILLVAVYLYRVNGLTVVLSSAITILFSLIMFNLLKATFTFASLIGLILVMILSLTNSLLFSYKMDSEIKKGKDIKKSYQDSSRKMSWLTIDISVIGLLFGTFAYVLANTYLSGLGIILFFGSIINFIVQFLINKPALYFLSTNSICGNNIAIHSNVKKDEINVQPIGEKPVDLEDQNIEESKEVKKPKLTRNGVLGICLSAIAVACAITLSIFSGVATPFKETSSHAYSNYAYVLVKKPNTEYDTTKEIETVLNLIRYHDETTSTYKPIYTAIKTNDYTGYTNADNPDDSIEFEYFVYTVTLSNEFTPTDENNNFYIVNISTDSDGNEVVTPATNSSANTLLGALTSQFEAIDSSNKVTVNVSSSYGLTATYNLGSIALSTFIALLVVTIYLGIRFGLSGFVVSLSLSSIFTMITLGVFSIIRTSVYSYITLATPAIAFITLLVIGIALSKYKEDLTEVKVKNMSLDYKLEVLNKNKDEYKMYIFYTSIISCLILLCYFGFSQTVVTNTFLLALFMVIISYIAINVLFGPYMEACLKKISTINLRKKDKPKSNKKRLKQEHKEHLKGKDVEEATFIGIND